ncbi:MAG TPA: zinc-binding alcohol dehydrogenase family protein [Kofleriaceae bacterium]|nr:zinc-binding alcohol dehydrogenase family protein [Kofleriaceae bacterium]
MRIAIEMDAYGDPDVLRPVERPDWEPGPGEVVVQAACAGVNRADLFIRSGEWPQGGSFPYVPGLEVAGTVAALGAGVTDLSIGDPVITMMQHLGGIHGTRPGGYQSHVLVPADTLARLPAGFDPLTAGALGLPAVTALLALEVLDVRAGHRVLVHAGSSAVGLMAIQLAAHAGAEVIATGTSPAKFDLMRSAGASATLSTRDPDWPTRAGDLDRAFDLVGAATFAPTVAALRPGGRLIFVGGTSGADLSFSGWALMRPTTITGYSSESLTRAELARAIAAIAHRHKEGTLRPLALTEFPLRAAATAHRTLASGSVAGRLILRS